jgi:hypothetical protein
MPEIVNINFPSGKPVGFFSKYHQADLFLYINGNFSVRINSHDKFEYSKQTAQLIVADLIPAVQSSLSLIALDNDIFRILADVSVFEKINAYMKVCLEDWNEEYGIEFVKLVPTNVSFDNESIEVIRIAEQMKANNISSANNIPQRIENTHLNISSLWRCSKCGCMNDSKFCKDCGTPKKETWKCICGTENENTFCKDCGTPKASIWQCSCGSVNKGNFCPKCGNSKK